ncbi:MAG TPA: NAD(P)/FAD-dependent oxidoreductase [Chloroflexia bacterium]|nr:NAD(P)/FAD-dependent oxidoreductase [Chloroflexia bacterium]
MYDVIIVGGGYSGLATAMQLRGHRVLLVDKRPIGSHQTSTCAIPLTVMRALGAEQAALELHDRLVLHTAGRQLTYPQRESFATFDHFAFCQALLAQTDATVLTARATAFGPGEVATTEGPVQGRFIVDASGWQGGRPAGAPARSLQHVGYGIETELPGRHVPGPGLHFFFERPHVVDGYAWAFTCGSFTRLGICTFQKDVKLGPALARHLDRWGLQVGRTHGGVLATSASAPLDGERFVVGDAAGQCLPMTGEGIRSALVFGRTCGGLIAQALDGEISAGEARRRYAEAVRAIAPRRAKLRRMQWMVAHTPDGLRALVGRMATQQTVLRVMMNWYYDAGGWITPDREPLQAVRATG